MASPLFVLYLCSLAVTLAGNTCCPDNWMAFRGSCYLVHDDDKYSWAEAGHWCDAHNAHLAYVETNEENTFIKAYLRKLFKENKKGVAVWFGATDETTEGIWLWYKIDEPISYNNWGLNQPNDIGGHEDCAEFRGDYDFDWHDYDCHQQGFFICEKETGNENTGSILG